MLWKHILGFFTENFGTVGEKLTNAEFENFQFLHKNDPLFWPPPHIYHTKEQGWKVEMGL